MKRLAKDQIALRKSLPPNYFFADGDDGQSLPDDLTQLLIYLTGPEGTPYSQGVWCLRLNIPIDYPRCPPTATFQTRIFHPNVAEETGAVCLETLKRDWDPILTLKDILTTISCLLIQPNPDSALNEKAGVLVRQDYEAFSRQARLMTKIHAPIPKHFARPAQEAKRRGDDREEEEPQAAQITQRQSTDGQVGTKDPVSKENLLADSVATPKDRSDKPLKRSLAAAAVPTDLIQEADREAEYQARRKSPKHSHPSEQPQDTSSGVRCGGIGEFMRDCASHEEDTLTSKKVIFRAQWASASGKLQLKARIGIRRL